jgi:protein-tyrosine phosphatase
VQSSQREPTGTVTFKLVGRRLRDVSQCKPRWFWLKIRRNLVESAPASRMDYAQILSGLFIGSHPRAVGDVERLRRESAITAVLNLQTDEDMRSVNLDWQPLETHYRASNIDLLRFPVKEEQIELREKLPECVQALGGLMTSGRTVYLHCTQGIGRSPTVAIGYLHWSLGWEFDVAVNHVKRARECSPHLEALRLAVWNPAESWR